MRALLRHVRKGDRPLRRTHRPIPRRRSARLLRLSPCPRRRRTARRPCGAGDHRGRRAAQRRPAREARACRWPSGWAATPGWWWSATMVGGTGHDDMVLGDTPNIAARLQGVAAPNTLVIGAVNASTSRRPFRLSVVGHPVAERCCGAAGGLPGAQREHSAHATGSARHHRPHPAGRSGKPKCSCSKRALGSSLGWTRTGRPGQRRGGNRQIPVGPGADRARRRRNRRGSPPARDRRTTRTPRSTRSSICWNGWSCASSATSRRPTSYASWRASSSQSGSAAGGRTAPLLARCCRFRLAPTTNSAELPPDQQKQQTMRRTADNPLPQSRAQQPVLFVVEDLQWVDPTTLEFLTHDRRTRSPTRASWRCSPAARTSQSPWTDHPNVTDDRTSRGCRPARLLS